MSAMFAAARRGGDRLWEYAEESPPDHARLILIASLVLILATNWMTGPTFAFGGLYALTICTAAWLLGFRSAFLLGIVAIAASTALNGVGGPYGGVPIETGAFRAFSFVTLRGFSLLAAAALISRVRDRYRIARRLADRDPLTGLHNHRAFCEALDAAVARAIRRDSALALAYVDLDDFKSLNDRLGHVAGDGALQAVAEAARWAVRQGDYIGRLGGDEFAILIEAQDEPEAREAVKRIHDMLGDLLSRGEEPLSFSMGAIVATPARAGGDFIQAADALMYRSKRREKGSLTVARFEEQDRLAA